MTAVANDRTVDLGRAHTGWVRHAVPVGLVLVVIPLVVAAGWALAHPPATAIRDHALMELRVRDIGFHPVNLGLYSRDGWSHLGPLVFFTLVIPYRIFGSSTSGMVVGALIVNGVSVVGMALIARRLGGTRAALTMLLLGSVLVRAMGANLVANPWVCFITVLPFGLFCCVMWALISDRPWALPLGVGLASWLVQTHVGYVPLTAPMLVIASIMLTVRAWRAPDHELRSRSLRAAGVALVVLAVAWALPIWDQLFGSGNLETAARWLIRADGGVHTVAEGVRVVIGQFAAMPDWVTGTRRAATFDGATLLRTRLLWPLLLVPFVATMVFGWRRGTRAAVVLGLVVGAGVILGIVSVARTVGTMYEYRLLWTWVLGALAFVVVLWVLWEFLAARVPSADQWLKAGVLLALLVLSVLEVVQVATADRPDWDSPATATAVDQLVSKLDRGGGQIVVRSSSVGGEWYLQGVVLALEKRGFDVRVLGEGGGLYGKDLVAGRGRVQARLLVLTGPELASLTAEQRDRLMGYGGSRSFAREVAVSRARAADARRLLADFNAGRITRHEDVVRLARLAIESDPAVAVVRDGRR